MNTENDNWFDFLDEDSDPATIQFVAKDANNGDFKDQHERWFTKNAIKGAFDAGLIKKGTKPKSFILLDGSRLFKRDDGCYGFTNKPQEKRH